MVKLLSALGIAALSVRLCVSPPLPSAWWAAQRPAKRQVLFGCFKRGLSEEVRVAQLAGYVSEHAAYHHGEASLQSTIVGMAQDFVGSGNNVRLLEPVGQFGTRLDGGKSSASPRYIHTHLTRLARLVFPAADDAILEWQEDDGLRVEPVHYLPVLPLVLVNGAVGIGTGYSTNVPCHDPRDVAAAVRLALRALPQAPAVRRPPRGGEGEPEPEPEGEPEAAQAEAGVRLKPWYRGFRGELFEHGGKTWSRGVVARAGHAAVRITELPLMTWVEDFKATLEEFVQGAVRRQPRGPRSLRRLALRTCCSRRQPRGPAPRCVVAKLPPSDSAPSASLSPPLRVVGGATPRRPTSRATPTARPRRRSTSP